MINVKKHGKKLLVAVTGFLAAFSGATAAANDTSCDITYATKDEQVVRKFTKQQLIEALRQMKRNPQKIKIKTISAMCYEMPMYPKTIEYQCAICGSKTTYKSESDAAAVIRELPYIKRSIAEMPYSIIMDASCYCHKCGLFKKKAVIVHVKCFSCQKDFSWTIRNAEDIRHIPWLYLTPPLGEIDPHYYGTIEEGATYINDHVFCPDCRTNNKF